MDCNNSNSNSTITAKQVALHVYALFYTAVDERTPPPERQFSLDAVKRTFNMLENQDETDDENEVASSVGGGDECNATKHCRDEDEQDEAEPPAKKREKKDSFSEEEEAEDDKSDDKKNNDHDEEEEEDVQNNLSNHSNDRERIGNKHSSTQTGVEVIDLVSSPDQPLRTSITNKNEENENEKSSTQAGVTSGETIISSPDQRISTSNQNQNESEKSADEMEVDASNNIETETKNNELLQDTTNESSIGKEEEVSTSLNNSSTAALQNQVDEEGVDEAVESTCRMEGDKRNEEIVVTDIKNDLVDAAVKSSQGDTAEEDEAKVEMPEKDEVSLF